MRAVAQSRRFEVPESKVATKGRGRKGKPQGDESFELNGHGEQNGAAKNGRAKKGKGGEKPATEAPVLLRPLNMKSIIVRIVGISPLILHAWSQKAIEMIAGKQGKKAPQARAAKDPQADYEACFYRDSKGRYCFISRAFKKAIVTAAASLDDRVNFPKTRIRQILHVDGDLVLINHKAPPRMRIDPVRLNGGTADLRYRPEFVDWSIDLPVTFDADATSTEQVVNLIERAGSCVGVGEWRVEKDGNFGRFQVDRRATKAA